MLRPTTGRSVVSLSELAVYRPDLQSGAGILLAAVTAFVARLSEPSSLIRLRVGALAEAAISLF